MKNGNGSKRLDDIEELLRMTARQTAENAKDLAAWRKEFRAELAESRTQHDREMKDIRQSLARSRAEHDREMKEIRGLFKQMIRRIAV
jgi:Sec-independent protein translocase protein TatA